MTQAASGYDRQKLEKYYTPAWVIDALLYVETFPGLSLDPCAGGWHIVDAMRARGEFCDGFDIDPEPGASGNAQGDFLEMTAAEFAGRGFVNIVTNPPYGRGGRLAHKMIRHALALTKGAGQYGKVAMLLPADWDSGNTRRDVFEECPAFAGRYVLTKRISWANVPPSYDAKGRKQGPTVNHCIFVWNWARVWGAKPVVRYLP